MSLKSKKEIIEATKKLIEALTEKQRYYLSEFLKEYGKEKNFVTYIITILN